MPRPHSAKLGLLNFEGGNVDQLCVAKARYLEEKCLSLVSARLSFVEQAGVGGSFADFLRVMGGSFANLVLGEGLLQAATRGSHPNRFGLKFNDWSFLSTIVCIYCNCLGHDLFFILYCKIYVFVYLYDIFMCARLDGQIKQRVS